MSEVKQSKDKPIREELVTKKIMLGGYDLAGEFAKFGKKIKLLEERQSEREESLEQILGDLKSLKSRIEYLEYLLG